MVIADMCLYFLKTCMKHFTHKIAPYYICTLFQCGLQCVISYLSFTFSELCNCNRHKMQLALKYNHCSARIFRTETKKSTFVL